MKLIARIHTIREERGGEIGIFVHGIPSLREEVIYVKMQGKESPQSS